VRQGEVVLKRAFYRLSIGVFFCLLTLGIQASTLTQQRADFIAAEKALQSGNLKAFASLKKSLPSYPLYPYLEYRELIRDIRKVKSDQMDTFLTTHANTPLARKARKKWLAELARRKKWWAYSVFFQPDLGKKYSCWQITAQLKNGHIKEAMQSVKPIWLTGKSLPSACDSILKKWKDAGHLTNTLIWQRIELAIKAKQTSLATYLIRHLDTALDKVTGETWLKVMAQPDLILSPTLFHQKKPTTQTRKIALQGFKRLLRKKPEIAYREWDKIKHRYALTKAQQYQGRRAILLSQMRNRLPYALEVAKRFAPNPADLYFQETRLRYALSQSQWTLILKLIKALPKEEQRLERWRYWKARALASTGVVKEANKIYLSLAKERSYHGFLAADIIGTKYHLKGQPLAADTKLQKQIARWPSVKRAHELIHFKRYSAARREWRLITRDASIEELTGLAKIAEKWGWHDRAIFTLARTGYWDDLQLRFPLRHKQQVAIKADKHQLSEAWVFAVIRQESAFSSDAVSPVGARGLMQLMPKTAAFIAKKINHKQPKGRDLANPSINISLGTAYLESVYSRLGQHQALATAAYNAGPHRVKSWLPKNNLSADIWIETIPFSETRRYTERVLYYTNIYEKRLGKNTTRLSSRTPDILPKRKLVRMNLISVGGAAL